MPEIILLKKIPISLLLSDRNELFNIPFGATLEVEDTNIVAVLEYEWNMGSSVRQDSKFIVRHKVTGEQYGKFNVDEFYAFLLGVISAGVLYLKLKE